MTTINIYVSRKGNSNNIKLRDSQGHNPGNDNITTDVNPGDTIVWQLDSSSKLYSLDGIQTKSDSENKLLAGVPTGSNSVFTGNIVGTSPGRGKIEKYMVGYTVSKDSGTIWTDPKLQMNT